MASMIGRRITVVDGKVGLVVEELNVAVVPELEEGEAEREGVGLFPVELRAQVLALDGVEHFGRDVPGALTLLDEDSLEVRKVGHGLDVVDDGVAVLVDEDVVRVDGTMMGAVVVELAEGLHERLELGE